MVASSSWSPVVEGRVASLRISAIDGLHHMELLNVHNHELELGDFQQVQRLWQSRNRWADALAKCPYVTFVKGHD